MGPRDAGPSSPDSVPRTGHRRAGFGFRSALRRVVHAYGVHVSTVTHPCGKTAPKNQCGPLIPALGNTRSDPAAERGYQRADLGIAGHGPQGRGAGGFGRASALSFRVGLLCFLLFSEDNPNSHNGRAAGRSSLSVRNPSSTWTCAFLSVRCRQSVTSSHCWIWRSRYKRLGTTSGSPPMWNGTALSRRLASGHLRPAWTWPR